MPSQSNADWLPAARPIWRACRPATQVMQKSTTQEFLDAQQLLRFQITPVPAQKKGQGTLLAVSRVLAAMWKESQGYKNEAVFI